MGLKPFFCGLVAFILATDIAVADELAACGIDDADYALAINQLAAASLRDRPMVGFFEISGDIFAREAIDSIEASSDDQAILGGLGLMRRAMRLMRIANRPPVWDGLQIKGETRLETIEQTLTMLGTMRDFSHRIHAPDAMVKVSQELSVCDSIPSKQRRNIASALAKLAYTEEQRRLYDGEATAKDVIAAINATYDGYADAATSVRSQLLPLFSFLDLSGDDVCRRMNVVGPGESRSVVDDRRARCALVLVGGGQNTEGFIAAADLSPSYFPITKVAGAAAGRGGALLQDEAFEAASLELLQLKQSKSVNSAIRLMSLIPGKDGQNIRKSLDELTRLGAQFGVTTPEYMELGFRTNYTREEREKLRVMDQIDRETEKIQTAIIEIWRKQRNRFDRIVRLTVSPDEIRNALRQDEVLLVLDHEEFVPTSFAMTSEGTHAANADVSLNELASAKQEMTSSIQSFVLNGVGRFPEGAAHTAYQATIAPVQQAFIGKKRLYLLANAGAQGIPFDALVSRPAQGGEVARYLVDDLEIVMIPSISALVELRREGATMPALNSYAAFSDPAFAQNSSRPPVGSLLSLGANFGDVATPCALPRVPATARVAETLAQRFSPIAGGDLRGGQATEGAVYDLAKSGQLAAADVVAFNTHGLLADQVPARLGGDPALALIPTAGGCGPNNDEFEEAGDGFLTAAELYDVELNVPLVLLTACNTFSAGSVDRATPLTGLARAFLAAGAKSIVVSNWDALVAQEDALIPGPTEMFVDKLFDASQDQLSFAARFRSAKLGVRETYPHPAAWAVFSLIGTGD